MRKLLTQERHYGVDFCQVHFLPINGLMWFINCQKSLTFVFNWWSRLTRPKIVYNLISNIRDKKFFLFNYYKGVASKKKSLFQHLQEYIEPLVSDEQLKSATSKYPFNTPQTKEAYFYREIFTELYPNCEHFTPYMWLPKWCGDVTDPSARVLKHYDSQQQQLATVVDVK